MRGRVQRAWKSGGKSAMRKIRMKRMYKNGKDDVGSVFLREVLSSSDCVDEEEFEDGIPKDFGCIN